MQPLGRNGYDDTEVLRALRGKTGAVEMEFRYDLLDRNNAYQRPLDNVQSCSVIQSYLADIKRTARFSLLDDGLINFASDRIMPWARLKMPGPPAAVTAAKTGGVDTRYGRVLAANVPNRLIWYRGDETTGTVARNAAPTGPTYNGTLSSEAMLGAAPLIPEGQGWSFNQAESQFVDSPLAGTLIRGNTMLTFGCWFRATTGGENDFLIDASTGAVQQGLSVRMGTSNQIVVNLQLDTSRNLVFTPADTVAPGQTYFLIVTWASGQDISIFVNGIPQTITVSAGTGNPAGAIVNPDDLQIGKWRASVIQANYLDGRMDEVFLADAFLAVDQIQALYTAGLPEPYLAETFATGINPGLWTTNGTVVAVNGRARMGGGAVRFGTVESTAAQAFDFTGGQAVFELEAPDPVPTADQTNLTIINRTDMPNNRFEIQIANGQVQFRAGPTWSTAMTYSRISDRWWRITYAPGTAIFSSSADGRTWGTRHTVATSVDLSDAFIYAYVSTDTTTGYWYLDNITVHAPNMQLTAVPDVPPWDGQPWVEWPQGVFLLTSPNRAASPGAVIRDVAAYDQLQVFADDLVTERFTATVGDTYTTVISGMLGNIDKNITAASAILPVSKEWEPGTSKLTIINDLCSAINYEALWFDEYGIAVVRPYVPPGDRAPEFIYRDDDDSVTLPNVNEEIDLWAVPNRWVLIVSDADRPLLRAVYTNSDPDSPTSTIARGRVITDFRTEEEAADLDTLLAKARALGAEGSQIFARVEFETSIMPFHSHNDVYGFAFSGLTIDDKFSETDWEITLAAGTAMKHGIRRVVTLWNG